MSALCSAGLRVLGGRKGRIEPLPGRKRNMLRGAWLQESKMGAWLQESEMGPSAGGRCSVPSASLILPRASPWGPGAQDLSRDHSLNAEGMN